MVGRYHYDAKMETGEREVFLIDLPRYLFPSRAGWALAPQTSWLVRSRVALSWVMAHRTRKPGGTAYPILFSTSCP